ncbi:PucR family transcriptional regulator [Streptosporangium lutulentum]
MAALPRITAFQYLALKADDTARHLVDPRITALLAEDRARGGVLTATIRAFAADDLNLRACAERLQIHPNTAQYRLRRIRERTGRNLRRINDLLDLLVAIALQDTLSPGTNLDGKRLAAATNESGGSQTYGRFHESR